MFQVKTLIFPGGVVSIKGDDMYSKGIIRANGINGGSVELLSKNLLINKGMIEANGIDKGGEIIVMSERYSFFRKIKISC